MSKDKFVLYTTILVLIYVFLPIVSMNIPIPGKWFLVSTLSIFSIVFAYSKVLLVKESWWLYYFVILYYFLAPLTHNIQEEAWFLRRWLPLVVSLFITLFYFKLPYDFKQIRIVFWLSVVFIVVSSITTINGLIIFPLASRELASNVHGNFELSAFYNRIGIVGYGFISAMPYIIPILMLLYKKSNLIKYKYFYLLLSLTIFYMVLKAQYMTQFILLFFSMVFSLYGTKLFVKYKFVIIIVGAILIAIPSSFYIDLIYQTSDIIPGEILKERLEDIARTFKEGNINEANTHIGKRFSRIPYLLKEFSKSPIIGGGDSTRHVYWLDHLSLYGIVGIIPWVAILLLHYKKVKRFIKKENFVYYQIALFMFLALGFMKGSGNREQFLVFFCILPLGLILYENGELFKKKKYEINK